MNKIFDEIEDLVLYYATDDYDYKKSVALFNVGKIEKMVDYCRYLQHQLEEKGKENQQLKENYDRIYNENCKLREKHNITDISLLDENQQLKKQKDDVVDWLNNNYCYVGKKMTLKPFSDLNDLLRMLGEIE